MGALIKDKTCACCAEHEHEHEHSHEHDHGHEHEHDHNHDEEVSKLRIALFAVGVVIYAASFFIPETRNVLRFAGFFTAYILVGGDVVVNAVRHILRGKVFDEQFLMSLSTIGAFAIGHYHEAGAVMIFYQVGEFFQALAVGQSRKSIKALLDLKADKARVIRDGAEIITEPENISVGETIIVRAGERIPLDGVITEGASQADTASITGESVPRELVAGDKALSGYINLTGTLSIKVESPYAESTVVKIMEMVESSIAKKAPAERFITKFARVYTPAVVITALVLAVFPPLFLQGNYSGLSAAFSEWIYNALVFLVVSCPCALVVSVPLSFFSGIGAESKKGILVKGGVTIQNLAAINTVVMDKTGTLTEGVFKVVSVEPEGISPDELLALAYQVEQSSNHPIARSVTEEYLNKNGGVSETVDISDFTETAGRGVSAIINGRKISAGNAAMMELVLSEAEHRKFAQTSKTGAGTVLYIAQDGVYMGRVLISDVVKKDAKGAISALKNCGVTEIAMLTGDNEKAAKQTASELGIGSCYYELLPADKVAKIEEIYAKNPKAKILFCGDGINDAPVLSRADVGVAMGGVGSDAAVEVSDVVILSDEPSKIAVAIQTAKNTMKLVKQNIIFALGVKFIVLLLSATNIYSSMWLAVFADVGVAFIVIFNSMRKK